MHSSLVVTEAGLPLGLAAIKFWTRQEFKGTNALKRKINPTRVTIDQKESLRWLKNLQHATALLGEPARCVHVDDRESDIYELFCAAHDAGTHFLVRACANRLASDGTTKIEDEMAEVAFKGVHRITVRERQGDASAAVLEQNFVACVCCRQWQNKSSVQHSSSPSSMRRKEARRRTACASTGS